VPLAQWFEALLSGAASQVGIFVHCASTARELLSAPRDVRVLHGDIHHGNVLDFGSLGWLAIDPKGLYGERGSITRTCSATPTLTAPWRPGGSRAGSRSLHRPPVSSGAGLQWVLVGWVVGYLDA
jgi:streptomycin 6-kinase